MEYRLVVEADTNRLWDVFVFLERAFERHGCPEEDAAALLLAAEEVFVNIAHYAYTGATGQVEVLCRFLRGPRRVSVSFCDAGVRYNPLERAGPDLSLDAAGRPVGGLGIFMVKESMDTVEYRYRDGKNQLTFSKKI